MSSTGREDIVTGERFETLAEILFMESSTLQFQPSLHRAPLNTKPRMIVGDARSIQNGLQIINSSDRPVRVFIYSHALDGFFASVFPQITRPIIVLSHNSDHEVKQHHVQYLDSPMIHAWYGQNARIHHPKLTAVPIGIANSQWAHGNLDALERVMKDVANGTLRKRESNDMFVCFAVGTNAGKRGPIQSALGARGWHNRPCNMPYETYLRDLATYRYAVSPPGNGIDCHRFWECIYLGVIPVVEDDVFYDHWPGIPIVRVTNWNTFVLPDEYSNILTSRRHCLSYYADSLL